MDQERDVDEDRFNDLTAEDVLALADDLGMKDRTSVILSRGAQLHDVYRYLRHLERATSGLRLSFPPSLGRVAPTLSLKAIAKSVGLSSNHVKNARDAGRSEKRIRRFLGELALASIDGLAASERWDQFVAAGRISLRNEQRAKEKRQAQGKSKKPVTGTSRVPAKLPKISRRVPRQSVRPQARLPRRATIPCLVETDVAILLGELQRGSIWLYAFRPRGPDEADVDVMERTGPTSTMLLDLVADLAVLDGRLVSRKTSISPWKDLGRVARSWQGQDVPIKQPRNPGVLPNLNGWYAPPVHKRLDWQVLPPGWWDGSHDLRGHSSVTGARKARRGGGISHIQFLDSLKPREWYSGSHLGSVVYYVAIFPTHAIADCLDEGNALYYVSLVDFPDWRSVFRLTKWEARREGAQRIIHTDSWRDRVRELLL